VNGLSGVVEKNVHGTDVTQWSTRASPNGVPLKENHTPGPPSGMISVLYVDDESHLLDITKTYLEKTKEFTVTTAPSVSVALELLKSNGIQVIVSDYQMPEMDGIEFLKTVRATDKSIPFIIFTGKGREEIAIEAFENGADFYLQKGGEPKSQFADLSHRIKKAVNHRRADIQVTALNRLYTVLSATNKAIVRIHDKTELLNEICRVVVDIGGFAMAWAGFANPEKHLIEPVAMAGHVEGYLDTNAVSTEDIPRGRGPTGTAFRTRTFNVSNDIARDPTMELWREEALERGYRSLAAFPFALDTNNPGIITVYASEPGFFTDQIIRLLDEQSSDLSFAFITLDHEEQRIAAENDLKKSELQYRRLFETAQDAILILDGDTGKIIDANRFILDMLGYSLEYFVGKHLWELGFIKDKTLAQHAFTELKTNGYIRYEDLPLETKDGRSIDVEFVSNAYLVGDKKIFQCNIRDVTKRKRAEEERSRLSAIVEHTDEAIIGKTLDGIITSWNAGAERMYGYSVQEMVGKSISLLVPPDYPDDPLTILERVKNGDPVIRYETLRRKKDGGLIHVTLIASPIRDTYNRLIGTSIIGHDITDKKTVQDVLQASETRYRRLFETAQDAILILDGDTGEIIDANPFILDLLGYPLEYCIGKHLWDLGFIKDKTLAQHAFTELKTNGYIRYEDLPLETKDGRSIDVEFVSNAYLVGDKKVFQCNIRDITERKRADLDLLSAQKRLKEAHRLAHIGIWDWVMESDTVTWSDEMYKIAGRDPSLSAPTYAEHPRVYTPASWDLLSSAVTRALTTGELYNLELELVRPDGNIRWVNAFGGVKRDGDGKVIGLYGTVQDITERKRAEDALRGSEEKYRMLFSNIQDGFAYCRMIYDSDGHPEDFIYLNVNPAFDRITGTKTVTMKRVTEVYPGINEVFPELFLIYGRVAWTGTPESFEINFKPIEKWLHISVYSPEKEYFVAVFEDITDRKQAEEALHQANKQLNLLSSITRHDILNQLMALKGYLELSREYLGENRTLSDFVTKEEKVANTIENQITFTRDYQNLGATAPAWQNVNASINKALSGLPMRDVCVEVDPQDPEIFADPLFEKVFYNLIDNALRYGGADMKTIRVSLQEIDKGLWIVCEDDGVGIPAEDKKKLFTRGFGKNTGLGLFLSREILAITGITITENGTPGKGARFEITVPKGMWRVAGSGE